MKTFPKAFALLKIVTRSGQPVIGSIDSATGAVRMNGRHRHPRLREGKHHHPATEFVSMLTVGNR